MSRRLVSRWWVGRSPGAGWRPDRERGWTHLTGDGGWDLAAHGQRCASGGRHRYSLVHGCYFLRGGSGHFRAPGSGRFRMQAAMAGLRVMVTQLVDNEALCQLMSQRRNPCNDMDSVHIQAADLHGLQNYIDADSALSILEAHHCSGVISAHSWDSPEENHRIYNLGGSVTPIAGASPASFISHWRASRRIRNPRFLFGSGFGYGADMNGLAGRQILSDMFNGAEAYPEMWERAYGVPDRGCAGRSGRFSTAGVGGVRLGRGSRRFCTPPVSPKRGPAASVRGACPAAVGCGRCSRPGGAWRRSSLTARGYRVGRLRNGRVHAIRGVRGGRRLTGVAVAGAPLSADVSAALGA